MKWPYVTHWTCLPNCILECIITERNVNRLMDLLDVKWAQVFSSSQVQPWSSKGLSSVKCIKKKSTNFMVNNRRTQMKLWELNARLHWIIFVCHCSIICILLTPMGLSQTLHHFIPIHSLPSINGQLIRFQIDLFVIITGYVYSVQCMKLELIVCDITVCITVNLRSVTKFSQNV